MNNPACTTKDRLLQQTLFDHDTGFVEARIPGDLWRSITQTVADFLQRVPRHVWAAVASARLTAGGHDSGDRHIAVLRSHLLQRVNHVGFGADEECLRLGKRRDVFPHRFRAADEIRVLQNVRRAFGVSDDAAAGIVLLGTQHVLNAENFVDHARARPEDHLPARDFGQITTEMLIRHKQNLFVGRHSIDDLARVAAGNDPIDETLHGRRGVDVGDRLEVMSLIAQLLLVRRQLFWLATVSQRAARQHVRQQHTLAGAEHLCGLGHEVDTAEDDGRCRHLRGIARELQAVTREVRHVLNVTINIEVSQDRGILLLFQPFDLVNQIERVFFHNGILSQNCECGRHDIFFLQATFEPPDLDF